MSRSYSKTTRFICLFFKQWAYGDFAQGIRSYCSAMATQLMSANSLPLRLCSTATYYCEYICVYFVYQIYCVANNWPWDIYNCLDTDDLLHSTT